MSDSEDELSFEEEGAKSESSSDEESDDDSSEGESESDGELSPNESLGTQNDVVSDEDLHRESCPICLNRFVGQELGSPDSCDHSFCFECIFEWSRNINTCPIDRTEFQHIHLKTPGGHIVEKVKVKVAPKEPEGELEEDVTLCEVCHRGDREDRLLLCDSCDLAYHCECLDPPLFYVPAEEFFCPPCSNVMNNGATAGPSHSRATTRRIPRTKASENVRSRVQNLRSGISSLGRTASSSRSTANRTPKKRRRRRRRTVIRKFVKLARTKKNLIDAKKGKCAVQGSTVLITYKRKYKRRKRKSAKTKVSKRSRSSSKVVAPPSTKQRIANQLGIHKPPEGLSLPQVKSSNSRTLSRAEKLPSHSLFGMRDQLMDFDEDFNDVASSSRSNLPSTSRQEPVASSSASHSPLDILDSIMAGQKMLHSKSDNIIIRTDGSLTLKNEIPQKKNSNEMKATSSRTPMHVALIKNKESLSSDLKSTNKTKCISSTNNENGNKISKTVHFSKKMPSAKCKNQASEEKVGLSNRFKNHKIDGNQLDRLKKKQQISRDSSNEDESINNSVSVNRRKKNANQVKTNSNQVKVEFQVKQEHTFSKSGNISKDTCIPDSHANNPAFLDVPIKKEVLSDDETNIDTWENSGIQKDIFQGINSERCDAYSKKEKSNFREIFPLNVKQDDVERDSDCDFSQSLIDSREGTYSFNENSMQIYNASKIANEHNKSHSDSTENHVHIKKEVFSDNEKNLSEKQEVEFLFELKRLKRHRKSRTNNNHFVPESFSIDKTLSIKKEKLSDDKPLNETENFELHQNESICSGKKSIASQIQLMNENKQFNIKQEILTSEDESTQIPETQCLPLSKGNRSSLFSECNEVPSPNIKNLIKSECLDDDDELPATQMLPIKESFQSKSKSGIHLQASNLTDQESKNSDTDSDDTSLLDNNLVSRKEPNNTFVKPEIVLSNRMRDSNHGSSSSPGFHIDNISGGFSSRKICPLNDEDSLPPTQAFNCDINTKNMSRKNIPKQHSTGCDDEILLPATQEIPLHTRTKSTTNELYSNMHDNDTDDLSPTQVINKCSETSVLFPKSCAGASKDLMNVSRESHFGGKHELNRRMLQCDNSASSEDEDLPPTQAIDHFLKSKHTTPNQSKYDCFTYEDENDLPPTQAIDAFIQPKYRALKHGKYNPFMPKDENDLPPTQNIDTFINPKCNTSKHPTCDFFTPEDENDLPATQATDVFIQPKFKTSKHGNCESVASQDDNNLPPTQAIDTFDELKHISSTKDQVFSAKKDSESLHKSTIDVFIKSKQNLENSKKTLCLTKNESALSTSQSKCSDFSTCPRLDISEDDVDDNKLPATQCVHGINEPLKMPLTSKNHRSSEINEEHNQKLNENAPEINMNEILSKISDAVKIVTNSCANTDKNFDCDRTEKVDSSNDCEHSDTQTGLSEIQKSHKEENENIIDNNALKKPNQDESAGVDSESLTIEQIKQKIAMSAKKNSPKRLGVHKHLPQVITSVGPKKQLVLKPSKQKTFSFHDVEKLDSSSSKDSKIITDNFSNSSCSSENKLEAFPEKGPTNFQNCLESNQFRSKSMSVENNANGIDTTNLSLQNFSVHSENGKSWKSTINTCQDSFLQEDAELLPTQSLKQPKIASKFDMHKCATNVKNQNPQKNKQKENHAEHKQKSEILLSSDDELPATQLIEPCTLSSEVMNKVQCKSIRIKENSPETLIDLPMKHSNESVFHINTNLSTKKVIDKHYKMEQINADLKERHLKDTKNKYAATTSSKKEIHVSKTCTNDTDDLPATQIMETDFAHLHGSHQKDKLTNISDNRPLKQLWKKLPLNALDKKQHACDKNELNESKKDNLVADDTDDLPATQMMKEELAHMQSRPQTDKLMKSNDSGKRYQKQLYEKLLPAALNKRQHASCDKNKLFESKNDDLSMNGTDDLPATQMIESDIGHLQNSSQKNKFMKKINSENSCLKQLYEKLPPNALSKKQHASCDKNKFNESEKSDLSSEDTDDLPATQMVGNDVMCLQNHHQKIKSMKRINSGNRCLKQLHEKLSSSALNKKQRASCDKNELNESENDLLVNDTDDLPATQMMENMHLQNSRHKIKFVKENYSGDRCLKQISEKLPHNTLSKNQHAAFDKNKLNESEKNDLAAEDIDDLPATQMVENDITYLQNSRHKIKSMKMINSGNKCLKQLHKKLPSNALNKSQHATCNKSELNESTNALSVNHTDDLPATQIMETTHLENSLKKIKFLKKNYSGNSNQKQFSEMLHHNALNKQHASCDKNDDLFINDTDDLPATQMIDDIKYNDQNKCGNKQKNNVENKSTKSLKNVAASTIFKNKKQTAFIEKNSYDLGIPKLCRKNVDLPPSHVIENLNLINLHTDRNKNNFKQSNNHDNLERKRDAHLFKSDKTKNTSRNKFPDFDDELPATQAIDDDKQPSSQDHIKSKKLEKCAKSKLKGTSKEMSKNKLFVSRSTENSYSVPKNINCDNIKNSIIKEQNFSKKRKYLSDELDDSSNYLHKAQCKDVTKRTKTDIIDTSDKVCVKKEVLSPKSFCNSDTEDTDINQHSLVKNNAVLIEIKKDPDAFENVDIKQEELEYSEVNDKSLSNHEGMENSNSPSNNILNLDINIKEEPLSEDECTSSSFKKETKFPNQGSSLLLDSKSENLTDPKVLKDSDKLVDRRQKNLNKNLVSDNSLLKCKKHSKNSSNSRIDVQNKIKSVLNNEMDVLPSIDLKSKPPIEKNKNKKKVAVKDISNNIVNKECAKENVDSTKKAVIQKRHFEETETRNTKKHKISSSNEIVTYGPKAKKQKLMHYIEIKKSEKLPDNYTEVRKVDKKLDLKEEIAAEIKLILKPFYTSGLITKENYKDIMRKAVPKVFVNCNKSIHPEKIKKLVLNYVSLLSCS